MKDPRYARVKVLIEAKHIVEFGQVFDHIPKAVVYGDLGMGFAAFTTRYNNPAFFSLDELQRLAGFMEIDPRILVEMILQAKPVKKKKG